MSDALRIRSTATGVRFEVRLAPRASKTSVGEVRDGRLVVRVTAPPVDQAANEALIDTIATALDVPRRSVAIVAGLTSRRKTLEVRDTTEAAVRRLSDERRRS